MTSLAYKLLCVLLFLCFIVLSGTCSNAKADPAEQYHRTLVHEAQFIFGIRAPIPMLAGQIRQESSWNAKVTAWDKGRGLAQFMDATSKQVSRQFPDLGPPDPYNPTWAIRSLVRYTSWLQHHVKGADQCQLSAAALKAYNAGLGHIQKAQRLSTNPTVWFGSTEDITTGQSATNFAYSRNYPRVILFRHQLMYKTWGPLTCVPLPKGVLV